jgi:hypothetical protein
LNGEAEGREKKKRMREKRMEVFLFFYFSFFFDIRLFTMIRTAISMDGACYKISYDSRRGETKLETSAFLKSTDDSYPG